MCDQIIVFSYILLCVLCFVYYFFLPYFVPMPAPASVLFQCCSFYIFMWQVIYIIILHVQMTVRDALNSALDEEMSADPSVFLMGEEVLPGKILAAGLFPPVQCLFYNSYSYSFV